MKKKINILAKCMVTTFIFTGAYSMNIQSVKAESYFYQGPGAILTEDQLKGVKIIQVKEQQPITPVSTEISRGFADKGLEVVNYAYNFLGKPYVYGANGPNSFDCSGLTQYVYNNFGVDLNRTTYTQVNQGIEVDKDNLQPGDLVFFNTQGSISHVGIYIGGGEFIHAPRTGKPVMISSLSDGYYSSVYATARRIL